MRQKFGQVLGKYSGLFQRVSPIRDRSVHFYARGHGKSVLPSMRLVLSTVSRPGNGQALCFCPSFRRLDQSHTGLVVHYRAREMKDRTIKHLRVFHVCTMNSRAHRHVRHVWESMLPSWVKNIRYISHDVSRIRLIRRHETTKRTLSRFCALRGFQHPLRARGSAACLDRSRCPTPTLNIARNILLLIHDTARFTWENH